MAYDFSFLEELNSDFSDKKEQTDGNTEKAIKTLTGPNKAVQGHNEEAALTPRKERQRDALRAKAIYKEYGEAIRESDQIRAEIMQGLKQGTAPEILLLKAMKCISVITGDRLFYEQGKSYIQTVNGGALLHPEPLRMELEEATQRLTKLEAAAGSDQIPPEAAERINNAIAAHKRRIEYISRLLEEARPDLEERGPAAEQ